MAKPGLRFLSLQSGRSRGRHRGGDNRSSLGEARSGQARLARETQRPEAGKTPASAFETRVSSEYAPQRPQRNPSCQRFTGYTVLEPAAAIAALKDPEYLGQRRYQVFRGRTSPRLVVAGAALHLKRTTRQSGRSLDANAVTAAAWVSVFCILACVVCGPGQRRFSGSPPVCWFCFFVFYGGCMFEPTYITMVMASPCLGTMFLFMDRQKEDIPDSRQGSLQWQRWAVIAAGGFAAGRALFVPVASGSQGPAPSLRYTQQ